MKDNLTMNRQQPAVKTVSGISDLEALAAGDVVKVMLDTEPQHMVYEGVINNQHSFMSWPFSNETGSIKSWRSEPKHLALTDGAVIFDMKNYSTDTYFPRCSLEYWEKETMLQAAQKHIGI